MTIPTEETNELVQLRENFRFYNKYYRELQGHIGEYVAIGNGRILGYAEDKNSLIEKYKDVKGVLVELITPEHISWIL
jgi:hypothetical protein